MKKPFFSLLALVMFSFSGRADTVSYENVVSPTNIDFNATLGITQFDPSMGTLNSVQLSFYGAFGMTITATNTGTPPISTLNPAGIVLQMWMGNSSAVDMAINPNSRLVREEADLPAIAPGDWLTTTLSGTGDGTFVSFTDSSVLGYFEGTGVTPLDFYSTHEAINYYGTSFDYSFSDPNAAIAVVSTYDFTPTSVPEPSVAAVGALGIGIFHLLRRCKNKLLNKYSLGGV